MAAPNQGPSVNPPSSRCPDSGRRLYRLHENEILCDLQVILKDGSVRTMTPLLAALSDTFEQMLTPGENGVKITTVELGEVSKKTLDCILRFYCGVDNLVTEENVEEIFAACEQYGLKDLMFLCQATVIFYWNKENCLQLRHVAKQYNLPSLDMMEVYIAAIFSVVVETKGFLDLGKNDLLDLVSYFSRKISFDQHCLAILAWLKANDPDELNAVEIFSKIKLRHITDGILLHLVMHCDYVKKYKTILDWVLDEYVRRPLSVNALLLGSF